MENIIVPFNEPPSPERLVGEKSYGTYNAGGTFNCRCVALPVVTLAQIKFPATIYLHGSLHKMSMYQFASISGMQRLVA